jgi:GxxExxY protein
VPVVYKGVKLEKGYQVDLLVANCCVVEIKSIDELHPIFEAQLLTYLRLGGWKVGLLLNFNVEALRDGGIRRLVLNLDDNADVDQY